MEKALKIIVALLLILTVFSMPPDFYRLVSFIVIVAFGILAYNSHINKKLIEVFTYIGLIIVFQPFYDLSIGGAWWKIINITIAVLLLLSLFFSIDNRKKEKQ
ncbi:DUF6804 family protein [Myroides injenensis]|uniref:DUF6804 family protein n=1 Tax=Myroides injenensis TaxID=1183151 RepID=UPI0002883379|nr:DUF6804 family protein [Myroides injenensis]